MVIKNYSNKLSILIIFSIVIILSGCFSHWQGDTAKVVISFGRANRGISDDYDPNDTATHQRLEHKIKFTNEAKTLEFTSNGGSTIEIYAEPGDWNVEIISWLDGDVYAKGTKDVSLKLGLNNETIDMFQAHLVKFVPGGGNAVKERIIYHAHTMKTEDLPDESSVDDYIFVGWYDDSFTESFVLIDKRIFESVTFYAKWIKPYFFAGITSLKDKLDWLKEEAIDGGYYDVPVGEGEFLTPEDGDLYFGGKAVTINLIDEMNQGKIIKLNGIGSLFTVGDGVNLKLDSNITLEGNSDNNSSLIEIRSGGIFEMKTKSKIINNTNNNDDNNWKAAGVQIYKNGKFTMNGGEISGNTTVQGGGGVRVEGIFIMNEGKIFNNTAIRNSGGGVWIAKKGRFTMNDGEIYGNKALGEDGKSGEGGGVHIYDDDRNVGTFIMTGGNIHDNTSIRGGSGVCLFYGNFIMSGGKISGNETKIYGGGVNVSDHATFTMKGGEISDNKVIGNNIPDSWNTGGGINIWEKGVFTLEGGEIYNNQVSKCSTSQAGGVNVQGTFIMKNGIIHNNKADSNGGGIHVGEGSTFTITGGKISVNSAKSGGGVYIWKGTFNMNGGEISGNNAKEGEGGGVSVSGDSATFTMEGGKIYNNMAKSGGGVRVWNGKLEKTGKPDGGRIYGNTATDSNKGNQVNAEGEGNLEKKRDYEVYPSTPLSYNGLTGKAEGNWDKD